MEGWNEFFNKKEQVNEHHKEGKDEQKTWICEVLENMNEEEIQKVYDFIENKLGIKE